MDLISPEWAFSVTIFGRPPTGGTLLFGSAIDLSEIGEGICQTVSNVAQRNLNAFINNFAVELPDTKFLRHELTLLILDSVQYSVSNDGRLL